MVGWYILKSQFIHRLTSVITHYPIAFHYFSIKFVCTHVSYIFSQNLFALMFLNEAGNQPYISGIWSSSIKNLHYLLWKNSQLIYLYVIQKFPILLKGSIHKRIQDNQLLTIRKQSVSLKKTKRKAHFGLNSINTSSRKIHTPNQKDKKRGREVSPCYHLP